MIERSDNTQEHIGVLKVVRKEIEKIREKYGKRADKEREKINNVYVTVKGEKCHTVEEINEWYRCAYITCSQADKYIAKLEEKQEKAGLKDYLTKSEHVCKILDNYLYNLSCEIMEETCKEKKEGEDK